MLIGPRSILTSPCFVLREALLFMQYDSDPSKRCRYTTHSSLTVNNMHTEYPRESIEAEPEPEPKI